MEIKMSKKLINPTKPAKAKKAKEPKAPAAPKPKRTRKRGVYYIDRKELLQNVIESKAEGKMNDALAAKLTLLTEKYGRHPKFVRYTYNDDMQGYALMMLVKSWAAFNPEKSDNPFAFYTQCIKNSFKQFLNQEKKHRDIRDGLLIENGLNPSYSYEYEHSNKVRGDKDHGEVKDTTEEYIDSIVQ